MTPLRDLADLPASTEFYIFGAGRGGEIMLRLLRRRPDIKVAGFVDNQKTGTLASLPILDFKGLLAAGSQAGQVIIASMYVYEIAAQLRRAGVKEFYNGHPLIAEEIERLRKRKRLLIFGGYALVAAAVASTFLI